MDYTDFAAGLYCDMLSWSKSSVTSGGVTTVSNIFEHSYPIANGFWWVFFFSSLSPSLGSCGLHRLCCRSVL